MARSVGDRRADILRAAQARFAAGGYDRTSTASICSAAGVSSGTFFHYFPTKSALLLAVLAAEVEQARSASLALVTQAATDAEAALAAWLDQLVDQASDPHLPVVAGDLAGLSDEPRVGELLREEAAVQHDTLVAVIAGGQQQGRWTGGWPAERLALWIGLLADGVLGRSIEDGGFDAAARRSELAEIVRRVLG